MAIERKQPEEDNSTAPAIRLGDFLGRPVTGPEGDTLRIIETLIRAEPKLAELPGVPSEILSPGGQKPETPTNSLTIVIPQVEIQKPQ